MNDEQEGKRLLTVANLIEDLQKCDQDAEVAVMIKGLQITIPVGHMSKVRADDKGYVLMLIAPESIVYAMSHMKGLKEELEKAQDVGIPN